MSNVLPDPPSPPNLLSPAHETLDGGEAQLIDVTADIEAPQEEEPLQSPLTDIMAVEDTKEEAKTAPRGELDDLEFWLSRTDASASSKTEEQPPAGAGETKPKAEATAEGEEGDAKQKKKREKVGVVQLLVINGSFVTGLPELCTKCVMNPGAIGEVKPLMASLGKGNNHLPEIQLMTSL